MVVETACTCDGLPPHSHVYRTRQELAARHPLYGQSRHLVQELDPYDVLIWVDWKEVARQLTADLRRQQHEVEVFGHDGKHHTITTG